MRWAKERPDIKNFEKTKKCAQPKPYAQKTQAPIVAKQTEIEREKLRI